MKIIELIGNNHVTNVYVIHGEKLNFQEKLRTKILTRLSKEGSSADEPTNIPLSDYSR